MNKLIETSKIRRNQEKINRDMWEENIIREGLKDVFKSDYDDDDFVITEIEKRKVVKLKYSEWYLVPKIRETLFNSSDGKDNNTIWKPYCEMYLGWYDYFNKLIVSDMRIFKCSDLINCIEMAEKNMQKIKDESIKENSGTNQCPVNLINEKIYKTLFGGKY